MLSGAQLGPSPPRRVAILRALKLGDMLCAVPALRALKTALPDTEFVLIGLSWAREFVTRFQRYLDGFLELPGFPGLPESPPRIERIGPFLEEVQSRRFDLVIQMHGSGQVTNRLAVLCRGRRCAGFYVPGQFCPDRDRFLTYPETGLEIRRLLRLVAFLGVPPCGEELEFPLNDHDHEHLSAVVGARGTLRPGEYACIHPGASVPERRWPAADFARVARDLAGRGLQIVITGTAAEQALARTVARDLPARTLDLAGRTDLGTLAALVAGARLLVCNDTGISHLAAALKIPSVVLSTGANPDRWAPPDTERHRVVRFDTGLHPDRVIALAEDLLSFEPVPVA